MRPDSPRWTAVTESAFPWEEEALRFIRGKLPDREPFRAWSNFEFVAQDGSIGEVDLLVVSTRAIYLVEVKSRPGKLSGNQGTWTWEHEGRRLVTDNPLLLANRKAKRLKSLLQKQKALKKGPRLPFIEPAVYLSGAGLRCDLDPVARNGVYVRPDNRQDGMHDIVGLLCGELDDPGRPLIPADQSRAIARALEQIGIRRSARTHRLGDYRIERLLEETEVWQDWEARHVSIQARRCRVRLYPLRRDAGELDRAEQAAAARREFAVLDRMEHPGILRAFNFSETERGPAIFFAHDPDAVRLDHVVQQHPDLDMGMRLGLLRQVAEALKYAHGKRIYHRALCPQSIIVCQDADGRPQARILDWQVARREDGTRLQTRQTGAGTLNPSLFSDRTCELYMAPEAMTDPASDAELLDVFSLGALGYFLFTGRPPANDPAELGAKLAASPDGGLPISEVLDGVGEELALLIADSTDARLVERMQNVDDFLYQLDEVEQEVTAPDTSGLVDPLDARPGDSLEGGFTVVRRLGRGATALALLVQAEDGRQGVLKVARGEEQEDRLEREARVLRELRHQNVIALYGEHRLSGRLALLLQQAGEQTLRQRLREQGPLSIDLLERFGDELLQVVDKLEQEGIAHRDLKPDNIGVGETTSGRLTIQVFDFSLTGTPSNNIQAGTPPYLEPFLRLRPRRQWDTYAERYAAAVTLYEMATGITPQWGDGSDPAALDCEVTLDSARFDPALRDALTDFFSRALRRDHRQRFDNAEQMRRAWHRVFETVDRAVTQTTTGQGEDELPDLEGLLDGLNEDSPLAELPLSPRLLNALERVGAQRVGELLDLPMRRLYRNRGFGNRLTKRIRELSDRLAAHFSARPRPLDTGENAEAAAAVEPALWSADRLLHRILHPRLDEQEAAVLRAVLGVEGEGTWPPQKDVAERLARGRQEVQALVDRQAERWNKQPWMRALRDDVAQLLERLGGIAAGDEVAAALVQRRGSLRSDDERIIVGRAVVTAALEAEGTLVEPRFVLYRGRCVYLVGTQAISETLESPPEARVRYAEALAEQAEALAAAETLASPQRAAEALLAVAPPAGDPPIGADRLKRLAVAGTPRAALSSRMEIYPPGMPAARALELGIGALLGPTRLSVGELQRRIAARYPEAERLPGRPELDALVKDAGLDFRFDAQAQRYIPARPSTIAASSRTHSSLAMLETDEALADFARRLDNVLEQGRYQVLRVGPKDYEHARRRLIEDYHLTPYHLEMRFLHHLRAEAEALGARWEVVLAADAAEPGSRAWHNLLTLTARAWPRVESELLATDAPTLVLYPAPVARYRHTGLFHALRARCFDQAASPACLVLVADSQQSPLPTLEGDAIPVVGPGDWATVPRAWARRRAGTAVAEPEEEDYEDWPEPPARGA